MSRLSFLEKSAENGCCLCALLYRKVSQNAEEFEIPEQLDLVLSRNRRLVGYWLQKLTHGVAGSEQATTLYQESNLYLAPLEDILPCLNPWELHSITASNTSSESCQQQAKSWLAKCKESHDRCIRPGLDSSWRPTRLIDLRYATGPDSSIRVVDTKAQPPQGEHVCLSHCWGGHQPITLTTETSELLKRSFPVSNLPRTFREAIQVCQWFNIRYLWIDSLGIIQDSRQDWEQEAPQMRLVYKNSEFTIAAADGRNCESGLFRDRIPAGTVVPILEVVQLDTITETEKKTVCVLDSRMWLRGVEGAPLNTRAWVLQERLLSPRVLHFGRDQLFWECKSLKACETFPNYYPIAAEKHSQAWFKDMSLFERLQHPGQYDENLSACLVQWNTIYKTYMQSKLTHQTDRVIALAGAADEIRGLLKADYLAGLWRCRFEDQLVWKVRDPGYANRAVPYRAPSWSLLSIDGDIQPPEHTIQSKTIPKELKVEVELFNSNLPTGEIKNGTINVHACLRDLSWSFEKTGEFWAVIGNDLFSNVNWEKFELFWDTIPDDPSGTCYLFSIKLWASAYSNPKLEGLALNSMGDKERMEMYRVGAFMAEGRAVCRVLQHEKCQGVGCKVFQRLRGDGDIYPRADRNIGERYDNIRKQVDSEKEEADRIKGELEESYMHSLQERAITVR